MVDVAPIYESFKAKGLQVLWVFGEGSDGGPLTAKAAQYFIKNTGVTFPVLRDYQFEVIHSVIDVEADLPHQFLLDGRTISVPLAWYPRLLHATSEQRANWEVCGGGYGIHWPEVNEDLSTEGLLRGAPAPRVNMPVSAV